MFLAKEDFPELPGGTPARKTGGQGGWKNNTPLLNARRVSIGFGTFLSARVWSLHIRLYPATYIASLLAAATN